MKSPMIAIAAAGCVLAATAGDRFDWYAWANDISVTNPAAWRVNSAEPDHGPAYGDDCHISSFGFVDTTIFFPTVDFYATGFTSWWGNYDTYPRTLTFKGENADGSPSVFTMAADSEKPRASAGALYLSSDGNSYYFVHSADTKTEPAFVWSNALVRATKYGELDVRLEFLRGSFDFSDSALANKTFLAYAGSGAQHDRCVTVFDCVRAKFANLYSYCRAKTNEITFTGGSYEVGGTCMLQADGLSPEGATDVRILSNAVVRVGGQLVLGDSANHAMRVAVADGGALESLHSSGWDTLLYNANSNSAVIIGRNGTYRYSSNCATWPAGQLIVTGENARATAMLPGGVDGKKGEFDLGVSYSSRIYVADGGTFGDPDSSLTIMVGHTQPENEVHLGPGGTLYCTGSLYTGGDYNGTTKTNRIYVTGGEGHANAIYMRPNYNGSRNDWDSHNFYHQTGGTMSVAGEVLCVGRDLDKKYGHVILDGGTLSCRKLYSSASEKAGYSAHADFTANGGTLAPNTTTTSFFYNFDSATLGTNGLTLALGGQSVTLGQKFANIDGQEGRLVKTGSGTLTLNAEAVSSTFSRMELKEGSTLFASGTTAFAPLVAVADGGILDVSNLGNSLALGGIELGGASAGVLKCKTTQTITLSSTVTVARATFMIADAHAAGTYPILRAPTASVAAGTAEAWASSSVLSGRQDGLCYTFTTTTDGDDTVFNLVAAVGVEPSNTVTWKGTGDDARWSEASNWEGTRQGAADVVTFAGGAGDATAVRLDANATVGKLAFTGAAGTDYTLLGDKTLLFADTGYAAIGVSGGTQTIETETLLNGQLAVDVAAGAKLALDGDITGGGITKTGKGELELSGANAFTMGFEAREGLFTADSPAALGSGAPVTATAKLGDGTLKIKGDPADAETALNYNLVMETDSATGATVVDTDANVTFGSLSATSGSLVKKGKGRLTFELGNEKKTITTKTTKIEWAAAQGEVNFNPDGTPPADNIGALTIAEGEVVFRGTLDGTTPSATATAQYFSLPGSLKLGTASTNALAATPRLVVDHAVLDLSNGNNFLAPYLADPNGSEAMRTVELVLTNSAYLGIATYFYAGPDTLTSGDPVTVNIGIYQSTYSHGWQSSLPNCSRCTVNFTAVDSQVAHAGFYIAGPFYGVMKNTNLSRYKDTRKSENYTLNSSAKGYLLLTDGSVLHAQNFRSWQSSAQPERFQYVFDDAELDMTRADAAHLEVPGDYGTSTDFSATNICQKGDLFDFVARGEMRLYAGLARTSKAPQTFCWYQPIIGTGSVVKIGKGILDFQPAAIGTLASMTALENPVSLRTTGLNRIEEGTMKVTDGSADGARIRILSGAVLDLTGVNAVTVSGAGVVTNGTLTGGTISVTYDPSTQLIAGDIPTIASALAGRNLVDLNLPDGFVFGSNRPTGLVIANYTGEGTPDLSSWRIVGEREHKARATFRVADGKILADILPRKGVAIVVR